MIQQKKILVIDFCNYTDYQIGGHLSFAKNMLVAFGNNLSLIGISTEKNEPLGKWFKKNIEGESYDYFALMRFDKTETKHLIPDRLLCFLLLRYYKKKITKLDIQNVFIQRHEILPAIINFKYKNICYRFPGLESPLKISKYWIGKYVNNQFDKRFFSCFKSVNLILAAGDEIAIDEMVQRSKGKISKNRVVKFPTRINTDIFKQSDMHQSRKVLNLSLTKTIICTTGRLSALKGWKFMIDSFKLFESKLPESHFIIIGEGEDFYKIQDYISSNNLTEKITLTGSKKPKDIALFLNASDLFIMGSYKEGWSTSLVEAVACGVPSCVTNFSSAKDIIINGRNGYVIDKHDPVEFVEGMFNSLKIPIPVYQSSQMEYGAKRLKDEILKIWNLV